MTRNTNSVRAQLASLCQDLIQEVEHKDALHHHHSNDHSDSTSSRITQQQHVVSIETALHRNPYAIFLHDPNVIATNLNTTVEKVQQIRKEAASCIMMQHETIGTGSSHHDLNWKYNDGTVFSMKSNMLLDYHEQMTIYKEKLLLPQDKEEYINNHYFSTGSNKLDQWLKKMHTSIIDDTILSHHSRKRIRSHYELQTTTLHNNDSSTNDNRTNGGISMGQITQIVGPSASGKTQLALTISAKAILFHSDLCQVHYIVGGGGNSSLVSLSRRFKSIASALLQQQEQQQDHQNHERYNHVMHKFEISSTYNAYMLLSRLNDIEANLDAQVQYAKEQLNSNMEDEHISSENNHQRSHLIVIDSISGCISSLVWGDGDGGAGASLMNEIALSLRRLSRMERFPGCPRVAVLVINGVVADRSTQGTKPALGEAWRASDCTILLEPLYNNSTVDIDLKSHPVGTPSVKDKIVRAKYGEADKNDEIVEFRISSCGITDL